MGIADEALAKRFLQDLEEAHRMQVMGGGGACFYAVSTT